MAHDNSVAATTYVMQINIRGIIIGASIAIVLYLIRNRFRACGHKKYRIYARNDSVEARKIMSELDNYGHAVIECLGEMLLNGEIAPNRVYFVTALCERYNMLRIIEGKPDGKETSYVLNKDEELCLCLRNEKMEFHDMELLRYVLLHEMTHVGSIETEHEFEFESNFIWLQIVLERRGLFKRINFAKRPIKYCNKVQLG
jgi:hypothetical protein